MQTAHTSLGPSLVTDFMRPEHATHHGEQCGTPRSHCSQLPTKISLLIFPSLLFLFLPSIYNLANRLAQRCAPVGCGRLALGQDGLFPHSSCLSEPPCWTRDTTGTTPVGLGDARFLVLLWALLSPLMCPAALLTVAAHPASHRASNELYTEFGSTLPVSDGCCPPFTMPDVFPQPWRGALTEGWGPQAQYPSHSSWPRSLGGHKALPQSLNSSGWPRSRPPRG